MQKALSPIIGVTGELEGAQNRTIEPKRLKQKILLSMHLLCIGLFATFLVWGLEGKIPINGDDVRVIRKVVLRSVDFKYTLFTSR